MRFSEVLLESWIEFYVVGVVEKKIQLLEQLSIELQELAGISGAGIGDDKADVEIVSGGGELPDEILPGDIKHDDSMLHTATLAKFNAYFLKQVLPPRHEDNIDS